MKKIITLIILIFLTGTVISCARWRVTDLSPAEVIFIDNGTEPGNVKLAVDNHAMTELSFEVYVHRNKILMADDNSKRVQVLSKNSKPELIIGNVRDIDSSQHSVSNFNFSSIGLCAMDSSDRIYVQNRLTQSGNFSRDSNFVSSFILMFDKNGRLISTIGQGGTADLPFLYIDSMTIDDKNRLLVVSRSFENWTLYRFTDARRDYFFDFGKLSFSETHGRDVYTGKIEEVRPYQNKDAVIISVAYYFENRLKHRTVYEFSMSNNKLGKPIIEIQNLKNALFALVNDRNMYFWNMDGRRIRFLIVNMSGTILNNLGIRFDTERYLYSKLFTDRSGDLYSFHVNRSGVAIYKWD